MTLSASYTVGTLLVPQSVLICRVGEKLTLVVVVCVWVVSASYLLTIVVV